jgi:uncharacterized protein YndB with AHSA1/START domain
MVNDKPLVINRYFNQPRELVWEAWANPKMFETWWGPTDFTCPTREIDLQVGGEFFVCMQGPDGRKYCDTGVIKEIVPFQEIVYTDTFADENGTVVPASYYQISGEWPEYTEVKVTFEEIEPGKTKMTLTHVGIPEEMMEGCAIGWEQSFDKLYQSIEESLESYRKAA